jgi:hypothetical protein
MKTCNKHKKGLKNVDCIVCYYEKLLKEKSDTIKFLDESLTEKNREIFKLKGGKSRIRYFGKSIE